MLCQFKLPLPQVNASRPHLPSPYSSIFPSHRRISRSLSAVEGSMSTCSTSNTDPESKEGSKTQKTIEQVLTYHNRTKHSFTNYARGPLGLDWANQPNPFLRFISSPLVPLQHFPLQTADLPPNRDPRYASLFQSLPPPNSISISTISQLFYDSLALSAWKTTGFSTWSLRVNPSSGNLHPTEAYLIAPPIESISVAPFVAHYAPKEHSLEIRAQIPDSFFPNFLPANSFLIGISSIFWREAWKYGERGFRYCNHDVGHAIGALAIAAAALGWDVKILDGLGYDDVLKLMGLHCYPEFRPPSRLKKGRLPDIEFEHPDCVIAVFPSGMPFDVSYPDLSSAVAEFSTLEWKGKPNALSKEHVCWDLIYGTAKASKKPLTVYDRNPIESFQGCLLLSENSYKGFTVREIVRKRRSAVDMDGVHVMKRETFYQILLHCLPSGHHLKQAKQLALPFRVLPWNSQVHAALFVHRVSGLPMGLYLLVRNEDHLGELKVSTRNDFKWLKPDSCPDALPLYELARGDCQQLAKQLSCHQDIASDGCFSLGMIARFKPSLHDEGAWMYPRLFWESGVLGQVLYLEAHAVGISATGIGCYFDDPVHELLGLHGAKFQSLYHFTVGAPLLDKRIMSLPAYPGPDVDA